MNHLVRVSISAVLVVVVASCNSQNTTEMDNIDVDTAHDIFAKDEILIVLDVRTPEEYELGHIDGALNISIAETDFEEKVAKLDRDMTYIVHCTANVEHGRSAKSLEIMTGLGFNKLLNMEGGIVAWQEGGHPLVPN